MHEVDGPCVDDLQSTMIYLHEQGGRGMAGSKNAVQMKNTVTTKEKGADTLNEGRSTSANPFGKITGQQHSH